MDHVGIDETTLSLQPAEFEPSLFDAPAESLPEWQGLLPSLAACVGIFAVYGAALRLAGTVTGSRSTVPPLWAWWKTPAFAHRPLAALLLLPPLAIFFVWRWIVRRRESGGMSERWLLLFAPIIAFSLNIAVCLIDSGAHGSPWFYEVVRGLDYPGVEFNTDVHFVQSARQYLHDYVGLHPVSALHCRTHPPGPVLFLYLVQSLLPGGLTTAALLVVLLASLSTIPAYFIARRLYDSRVALIALSLLVVTPTFVLHGTTCMDAVYMLPMLVSVLLFLEALRAGSRGLAIVLSIGLGLTMALCAMLTFSTCCVGLFMAVYTAMTTWRSRRWKRASGVLLLSAFSFVAAYLVLFKLTGFNLIACVKISMHGDEDIMGTRAGSIRRYLDFSLANLAAFLIGIGLPATVLLSRVFRSNTESDPTAAQPSHPFLPALVLTVVLLSFSTLFRLETERIWIFMAPLALGPIAAWMAGRRERESLLNFSMGAQFAQTMLMQVFLFMLW